MKRVNVCFQGPDFNEDRNPTSKGAFDKGFSIIVDAYDFDYGSVTVDPDLDEGINWILAVPAPYMNEEGRECGEIAWRIAPDPVLLDKFPELHEHYGKVYGRIIVTGAADV